MRTPSHGTGSFATASECFPSVSLLMQTERRGFESESVKSLLAPMMCREPDVPGILFTKNLKEAKVGYKE